MFPICCSGHGRRKFHYFPGRVSLRVDTSSRHFQSFVVVNMFLRRKIIQSWQPSQDFTGWTTKKTKTSPSFILSRRGKNKSIKKYKFSPKNLFATQCSFGHLYRSFDNIATSFPHKVQTMLAWNQKKVVKTSTSFSKTFFLIFWKHSSGHAKGSSHKAVGNCLPAFQVFFADYLISFRGKAAKKWNVKVSQKDHHVNKGPAVMATLPIDFLRRIR